MTLEWAQFVYCIACLVFASIQNWRAAVWRRRYYELRNNPVIVELGRQLDADAAKYEETHPITIRQRGWPSYATVRQRWCMNYGGFFDADEECRFCRRHQPFDFDKKKAG